MCVHSPTAGIGAFRDSCFVHVLLIERVYCYAKHSPLLSHCKIFAFQMNRETNLKTVLKAFYLYDPEEEEGGKELKTLTPDKHCSVVLVVRKASERTKEAHNFDTVLIGYRQNQMTLPQEMVCQTKVILYLVQYLTLSFKLFFCGNVLVVPRGTA